MIACAPAGGTWWTTSRRGGRQGARQGVRRRRQPRRHGAAPGPVCALLSGGKYAEKVVVLAGQLLLVPEGVSLTDAAGLLEVACTIWSTAWRIVLIAKQLGIKVFVTAVEENPCSTHRWNPTNFGLRVGLLPQTHPAAESRGEATWGREYPRFGMDS
uniref:Uncharacterized protein n=1 Tax=Oryza sativa subsp. japonica TaxID=39947 RepID=Q69T57_ORYSJ|nr:hypothetical protein [Oryza sativa Japonica Group]